MNVGISVPLPACLVGVMARQTEGLGFESFFCAEHPFIPVQTQSRFPGSEDGVIPDPPPHERAHGARRRDLHDRRRLALHVGAPGGRRRSRPPSCRPP